MTMKYTALQSEENVLTTEMDALANAGRAITGTAFSNDAAGERWPFADFKLDLAVQGSARSAGARVDLYILSEVGAEFAYGSASLTPSAGRLRGSFLLDAATTARVAIIEAVRLPPTDFHVLVINNTGQAFAATGTVLSMERYSFEDV